VKSATGKRYAATRPWARVLASGAILNLLLLLPAWWRDGALGSVWIAPEAWLLPALVALFPAGRAGFALRAALAALLAFVIVAGFFDALVQSVLGRALNVFIDPLMLRAGFHLIDGSLGTMTAVLACLLLAAAVSALAWSVFRLLASPAVPAGKRVAAILLVAAVSGLPWLARSLPGVESQVQNLVVQQSASLEDTRQARAELLEAVSEPRFRARELSGLAGRDVYVVFVESYGSSVIDQPRYSGRIEPLLSNWHQRLEAAGLSAASTRVEAPIRGGQSWLSHATVLSGLSIDSELWYRMLLARDIDLLSHDFRATGHVALNIAPGIVMDWPEGEMLGFDHVHAADDLGYQGPRLGWVTMPDEYTLHAFSERIRPQYDRPVFAQIALISSHWPWQPVIEPEADSERIGRGRVYEKWRGRDGHAASLLFDPEAMRAAYARSIEYSLKVTFDWARRSLPRDALLIVLGDHQPVSLVTGRDAPATVPVHAISGDPALLERLAGRGFDGGLVARHREHAPDMARLRQWLREDFGAE
jgi:hypothetical protein